MTIDQLPGEITIPDRDKIKEKWLRSYKIRQPLAEVGDGTQPDLDASVFADQALPLVANSRTIGQNIVLEEARGKAVDQWAARVLGDDGRRDAAGGIGFATIAASVGGGTIFEGDEIKQKGGAQLRYRCLVTDLYIAGSQVPIGGIDTGLETNLPAGEVLAWANPRPGIGPDAVVAEQFGGKGLDGGRAKETDEELVDRIRLALKTQANSGNDAEYQQEAERTPTVPVQKAFTYPCILGPGTTAIVFTLRPASPGASRVPTPQQVAQVRDHLIGLFPADDGIFVCELVAVQSSVVYRVTWDEVAKGWADLVPWPPYQAPAGAPGAIVVQSATSPTSFILKAQNNNYTGQPQPQVGQTIGFYDQAQGRFRRKRILSIVGAGPWTITVDTTNNASDESYTPVVAQRAMPWSDSLDALVAPVVKAFGALGPSEQLSAFFDVGRRQRRSPRPPRYYPIVITNKALERTLEIPEISDGDVQEGSEVSPGTGTAAVQSKLLELGYISAFPQ